MPRGRQLAPLTLAEETREQLTSLAQSTTLPHSLVLRAKMILASAEGISNVAVGRRIGASEQAVGKWRRRFLERGVEGLHDELRPGRPRTFNDERVAGLINRVLQERPQGATHWSTRTLGQAEGVSQSTVSRWLRTFGVQPHRTRTFKLSNDPFFIEKVRDIVGLYQLQSTAGLRRMATILLSRTITIGFGRSTWATIRWWSGYISRTLMTTDKPKPP